MSNTELLRRRNDIHYGFTAVGTLRPIGGMMFEIVEPFEYRSLDGRTIVVPSGVTTDFASCRVGRFSLLSWRATFSPAPVLHDYLYSQADFDRAEADRLFREALQLCNIGPYDRTKAYWGVRLFGWLFKRTSPTTRGSC